MSATKKIEEEKTHRMRKMTPILLGIEKSVAC